MTFGRQRDKERSRTLVRRDAQGLAALVLLLIALAPSLVRAQGADSLVLRWTAPGDDGDVGTAAYYELRMSASPITAANFSSALIVPGTPDPQVAGTVQFFTVRGLQRGTPYWFAIRTMDETGNWSPISNVVQFDWPPDASPPSAPSNLAGQVGQGASSVRLTWAPNPEPDLAGYRIYRATNEAGPWTRVASPGMSAVVWTDTSLPPNESVLWYSLSAVDKSGGEGARSAALEVALNGPLVPLPTAWGLEPPYPNPASAIQSSRIPVLVPAGGGAAHVNVIDATGRLVRRLDVPSTAPGTTTLVWDGRNDAGKACAPGVYRAVLEASGVTRTVNVARVP